MFSHSTAALLFLAPLPERLADALHVSAIDPVTPPRRPGVVGHQLSPPARTTMRHGMPVVDASTTFLQLASVLPLDELIVLGDHLVHDPPVLDPRDIRPYVPLADLRLRVDTWNGRGRRRAIAAIAQLTTAAESRPETLLRLLLARAGLPAPEVNPELVGIRRRWTHRADLVYRDRRVIVEYDGDQHRTSTRQYELDIRRFDDFADDGWRVVRIRAHGLFSTPLETVDRVRSALTAGGTLPRV